MFKRFASAAARFSFATLVPSYAAVPSMAAAQPAVVAQASPPITRALDSSGLQRRAGSHQHV